MSNVNVTGSEMVSLNVPSSVLSMLTNIARDVVMSCAARHGFDADEEMRHLGLDVGLVVELKKGKSKKDTSVEVSVVGEKSFRGNFPLPYNGGHVLNCCSGLKENHGLMTQCQNGRKGDDKLCKTCDNQASKNENGLPTYGTIEMRNACGIFEYVAPNGKSPVAYSKVMKKLNLSMEQVVDEASKRNMVMADGHFVEVDSKRGRPAKSTSEKSNASSDDENKEKPAAVKGKGRPKKAEKVVEIKEPAEDLFATLLATSKDAEKPVKKISKKKASAAVEEVKVDEIAVVAVAEVAVEEVKVAEIAVKDTKVKKAVAKIEAKKAEPVPIPEPIVEVTEVVEVEEGEDSEDEDDEESDSVTRMEYKGVKYLKSSNTGVIYNMDEDVVGKWNEKTKEIDFHDVEEEEEEYDEE
jgi:hypothetical protein